jgi:hypothetical protein
MREAREKLQRFRTEGGPVIMPMDAFIITAENHEHSEGRLAKNFDNGPTNRPDAACRTCDKNGAMNPHSRYAFI